MAYTDPDVVRLALSPGGDDSDVGSAASLDDPDLEAAISDATDEVNAKLAGRYAVPFADPAPDLIKTLTTAIAGYLVTLTYRRGDPLLTGDPVLLRYTRAELMLAQLQSGAMILDPGSTSPAPDASELIPVYANPACTTLLDTRNPPLQYPSIGGFGGGVVFVP